MTDFWTQRPASCARCPAGLDGALVSAGYYVGGIIGIALRFPPSGIATIWPPTAILLSALLLTPPRTWWVYLLAAIPTHIHLVANFQPDVPPLVMFAQVGTNVLHAVLAALAVRSAVGAPPRFDSLRSMVLYILYAPIASTIVACVLAASAFVLLGWAADFWLAFRQRVLANVFAIITIPPLIVMMATGGLGAGHYRRWSLYAELGLLTMALLAVGFLVFGRLAPASGNVPALLLTPMPLLLWAAVRLGPGGLCVCLLVIAGLSLSEAFAGRGPFVTASPAENTFSLQVFLLAISAPLMILAAIVQERERAESALHTSVARIREMGGRLLTAQEEERTRIASELHDDISQQLATLKLNLHQLAGTVQGDGAPHASEAIKSRERHFREHPRSLAPVVSPHATVGRAGAGSRGTCQGTRSPQPQHHLHPRPCPDNPPARSGPMCASESCRKPLQNALKHSHATTNLSALERRFSRSRSDRDRRRCRIRGRESATGTRADQHERARRGDGRQCHRRRRALSAERR